MIDEEIRMIIHDTLCHTREILKFLRSIKTDNGFDIKGNLVDFEDPMKYSVRQNEDGTVDIVIKNVSFFEEK